MKVRSTMLYNGEPIADCEWTLDDRARTSQKALAALSIEDHLRAQLEIKHEELSEEDNDDQADTEAGPTCDSPVQDNGDGRDDRVEHQREVDEGGGQQDSWSW